MSTANITIVSTSTGGQVAFNSLGWDSEAPSLADNGWGWRGYVGDADR